MSGALKLIRESRAANREAGLVSPSVHENRFLTQLKGGVTTIKLWGDSIHE